MAQIANITVYDGAATPVQHVLAPVSVSREKGKVIAHWREQLAGVPLAAQVNLTASMEKLPRSGVWKTEMRLEVPVQETVSGQNAAGYTAAPKVAYVNTMITTGFFHERSDVAGRRLTRQMLLNIVTSTGASSAAITSGASPDLFDTLVAPT